MSDPARVASDAGSVRAARVPHRRGHPHPRPGRRPSPGAAATPRVDRPLVASASPRHGSASATPLLRAALDARLERLRAKYGIPGISASILFADGSVWHGAAGLADVAAKRKVTADTAFPVASVSKTFTAALILDLVEDGRLDLDASVRIVPADAPASPRRSPSASCSTTRAGCATSTSTRASTRRCSARPARVWDAARSLDLRRQAVRQARHVVALLEHQLPRPRHARRGGRWRARSPSSCGPGSSPRSGSIDTLYQWRGATAGARSRTDYRFVGTDPKLPAIDLSDGTAGRAVHLGRDRSGAAGSIATTSSDLVRWARALYGGDALEPATRAAMVGDIAADRAVQAGASPYGLGVQGVAIAGHPTLGHSGRFLGARAVVRWLTDEQHRHRGHHQPEPDRHRTRSSRTCSSSRSSRNPTASTCPAIP